MQELRFVAVSEDGSYAVLAIPGRSGRFMLPIDDRLRAVARGQFSRLAQYEIEVENPLRPKEIQARIRAGETVEEIADAAGIPVERVRWFEGPVLAERGYVAEQAQRASVRRQGDSTPGPILGEVVAERLTELGADPEDAQWDSRKHGDGSWQVQLAFRAGSRLHIAEWLFDPRRRHVSPADDNAERLSLPEAELPQPSSGSLGAATVTPIRPRPERREAAPQHQDVAEPVQEPARAAAHAASPSFAPPRPPIGRPPSLAAPHPSGGSRPMSPDDQRNGPAPTFTDHAGPKRRGPADHGSDRRPADESMGAPAGSPVARRPDTQSPASPAAEGPTGRPAAEEQPPGRAGDRAAARDQDRPSAATAGAGRETVAAAPTTSPTAEESSTERAAAGHARTERSAAADTRPERAASAGGAAAREATAQGASAEGGAPQAPAGTEAPADQAAVSHGPADGRPQTPAPAAADKPADETPARGRGKKAAGARGRRSSVPSWDEIMLGNSRQPD